MAGHSKFKNIMHRKGRADASRSKLFSKLSRDITVAAKSGMPDVALNPRLRLAVNNAKAESLPKDVIQRAINKAAGGDVDTMEEVRYEGRGPGGVGIIVEALTDNRNRAGLQHRHGVQEERRGAERDELGRLHVGQGRQDHLSRPRPAPRTPSWRPPSRRAPRTSRAIWSSRTSTRTRRATRSGPPSRT